MQEKNDMEKFDDVMLPGFRFHPTDEELVDFYLKRKIQQKSLPIELIKQVDIYKYDPWDLPKLTSNGEKEWYFYCPRDRKYRNSARPNRVTRAGFWKATGTDRPIYSSEGKCIGLKKSLVFYRGRAAKGIKTDWMMHEFRLPSVADPTPPPKKPLDKSLPLSDSWAICRIFKKTNSISMAQKALSHPWITQLPESMVADILNQGANYNQFGSENMSCTTEIGSSSAIQFCGTKDLLHQVTSSTNFQASDIPSYKPINSMTVSKSLQFPVSNGDLPDNFIFSALEASGASSKCGVDASSMVFNTDCVGLEGLNMEQYNGFSVSVPQDMQGNMRIETGEEEQGAWRKNTPNAVQAMGFPFSLPPNIEANWKPNLPWESPTCPSELSSGYSTHKCYT